MRLSYVNDADFGFILVCSIDSFEFPSLGSKWRSGVTAKDEHSGSLAEVGAQRKGLFGTEHFDCEVRCLHADLQISLALVSGALSVGLGKAPGACGQDYYCA